MNQKHDVGVARQIGAYRDAVEVPPNARWLFTSGTPGLALDGSLPADIAGQAELAWRHIVAMLERAPHIPAYDTVRARVLGDPRPASMLLVVGELVRPEFLLEVEAVAAALPATLSNSP